MIFNFPIVLTCFKSFHLLMLCFKDQVGFLKEIRLKRYSQFLDDGLYTAIDVAAIFGTCCWPLFYLPHLCFDITVRLTRGIIFRDNLYSFNRYIHILHMLLLSLKSNIMLSDMSLTFQEIKPEKSQNQDVFIVWG